MKALNITLRRVYTMAAGIASAFVLLVVPTSAAPMYTQNSTDGAMPLVVDLFISRADVPNEEYSVRTNPGTYDITDGTHVLLRTQMIPSDVKPFAAFDPVMPAQDILSSVYTGFQARAVTDGETAPEAESFTVDSGDFMPEANAVLAAVLVHVTNGAESDDTYAPDEQEDSAEPEDAEYYAEEDAEYDAQIPYVTEPTVSFIWPTQGEVTSRFGYRSASVGSTNHKGIDIGGDYGQSIYAADAGEVIVSGWSNSYGYVVQILHENGYVTLYCHCSKLLADVGETVSQGQEIARMGATGLASGTHLHFEILIDGVNVDPLLYLPSS